MLAIALRAMHKAGVITAVLLLAATSGWSILEYFIDATLPLVGRAPTWIFYVTYVILPIIAFIVIRVRHRSPEKHVVLWLLGAWVFIPLCAEGLLFGAQF